MEQYETLSVPFLYSSLQIVIPRNRIHEVKMKSCTVHIKAGTTLQIPVIITEESTVLNWFYVPKNYDIDYRITKTNSDGGKDVIVPTVQSKADVSHQGKVLLVETGTYFLEWDNSTSWLREKCVSYHFSLKFPDLTQEKKIQCSK